MELPLPERLRVVRRGIDPAEFDPDRVRGHRVVALAERWNVPPGSRIVLIPPLPPEDRGHLLMLRALARLPRIDCVALFAGGPDGAGVIALARQWGERRTVRLIAGNHEEMFLDSFEKREVLRHFLRYGGRETMLSYPVDLTEWNAADLAEAQALMAAAVPGEDNDYPNRAEDMILTQLGVGPVFEPKQPRAKGTRR